MRLFGWMLDFSAKAMPPFADSPPQELFACIPVNSTLLQAPHNVLNKLSVARWQGLETAQVLVYASLHDGGCGIRNARCIDCSCDGGSHELNSILDEHPAESGLPAASNEANAEKFILLIASV